MSFLRVAFRTALRPHRAIALPCARAVLPHPQTFALPRAWYSASSGLSSQDIETRILDVLKSFEKVDSSQLLSSSSFAEDLGLDSLDAVEVVMAIEEEFSIEIPDAEADEIKTVKQAIDYIAKTPDVHITTLFLRVMSSLGKLLRPAIDQNEPCRADSGEDYLSATTERHAATCPGNYKREDGNASRNPPLNCFEMTGDSSVVVHNPLIKVSCTLGEGPLYEAATGTLHFVDIVKKQVFHYNTNTSELSVDNFNEPVSCLSLRQNGRGLACAAGPGFAIIDPTTHELKYLSRIIPEDHSRYVRFNDGACDSRGHFFAGTICSKTPYIPGQLYQFNPNNNTAKVVDPGPFTDCNGLGWSADEKTFYLTDSLVDRIYAYDYDNGNLTNKRIFIDGSAQGFPERTYPDGLCIDSEGCIWSARWGGSKVVRHTKDGTVDFEIHFPSVLNVTACCFGGPKDDQLFVTTAHCGAVGGDASRQAQYPDSGDIFQVDLSGRFKGGKWRYQFAG